MSKETIIVRLFFAALVSTFAPKNSLCQELQIDHVILINSDLPGSIRDYIEKGFTIKEGRLHENGLINAHIKFQNSSSVELMSIEGQPNDEISKTYESLLKKKIKGAYVALTGLPIDRIESELKNLNIEYRITVSKLWSYISFPSNSELAHIFFIIYHQDLLISEEYTKHTNGIDGIKSVKIEGTQTLIELLKKFGLHCEMKNFQKAKFATRTGHIIVEEVTNRLERPKINEIILGRNNASDTLRIVLD